MAADVVQSDYERLGQVATQFQKLHDQQTQMEAMVRQTYQHLRNTWHGDAAVAFFAEMDDAIFPTLKRLQNALTSASTLTTQISQTFRQAEEEASKIVSFDQSGTQEEKAGGSDTINDQMRDALQGKGYDANAIKDIIANATPEQLKEIWSDSTLMAELHKELGTDNYLNLVVSLGMNHSGSVAHTSAPDADTAIRDHLGSYVTDAVADNRQITGRVGVVDDTNWDIAGINHYGQDVWESGKRDAINGFVDSDGRVWIHQDKGNPGTMIHEGVHKYSDEAMIGVSQPLNEGVTEYFTRSTTDNLGLPSRGNYQGNYEFVSSLSSLVGEDVVADAYFNGNMDGLKDAYVNAGYSEAQWDMLIEHTQNNEWADAELLTAPIPAPGTP
ncbi:WXG100 family type VII secretion target [Herpetosiphon giganteus]|uniref:WXG100 family type VII secretion target n=1 Tax=Herpetosiphon giganteus TaxID=2029754 RepID=UPI00195A0EA0|nr:WXG100 family type VII secretion target [Herpetosiphon giganteus]MBM7843856.1 WXG100 family type VII secretion target [Herpetosiphon giganteus]